MAEQVTTLYGVEAYVVGRIFTMEEITATVGLGRHQARMFRRIRGLDRMDWDPDIDPFDRR